MEESSAIKTDDTASNGSNKGNGMIKVQKLDKSDKDEQMKMKRKPTTKDQKILSEAFSNLKKYKDMFSHNRTTENEDISSPELKGEKDSIFSAFESSTCSPQRDSRCSPVSPDVTFVGETVATHQVDSPTSPNSLVRDDNLCSSVSGACLRSCGLSTKSGDRPSIGSCSVYFTPKDNTRKSDKESALTSSVNSHTQRKRSLLGVPSVKLFQSAEPDIINSKTLPSKNIRDPKLVINLEAEPNRLDIQITSSCSGRCLPGDRHEESSCHYVEKKFRILCLTCKYPLGPPENNFTVTCSLTSLSKIHLVSLLNNGLEPSAPDKSTSTSVLIADVDLFQKNLCDDRNLEGSSGTGVWCEQDGCVFKSIYCPSCRSPKVCLGVQIMATDSLNVYLLNKVILYPHLLETFDMEVPTKLQDQVKKVPDHASIVDLSSFEYKPSQSSEGWRIPKSKLRLPKRATISSSEE